jgi:uncharacterized protein YfaQ (DUF2300 family)
LIQASIPVAILALILVSAPPPARAGVPLLAQAGVLQVALRGPAGGVRYLHLDSTGKRRELPAREAPLTPMGSLWKLFVYAYLVENRIHPQPYVCTGEDAGESFCCLPRQSIDFSDALAKSCGLFFRPERLHITGREWRTFWEDQHPGAHGDCGQACPHPGVHEDCGQACPQSAAPQWLTDLDRLNPELRVPVAELLEVLAAMQQNLSRIEEIQLGLARVTVDGTAGKGVRYLGASIRGKTFTWNRSEDSDNRDCGQACPQPSAHSDCGQACPQPSSLIGGMAGWLQDGTALWLMGRGSSGQVLQRWGGILSGLFARHLHDTSSICVKVDFFDKYPIREVLRLPAGNAEPAGVLEGRFRVRFKNGNPLEFSSNGAITLERAGKDPLLKGVFRINDYLARVLEREASADPPEAAKALVIAARTYLLERGGNLEGCYHIRDSTALQRVSIHAPGTAARRIGTWTDGIVVGNVPSLQYHRDRDGANVLSWTRAVQWAKGGKYFDEILAAAYPAGRLRVIGYEPCRRMPNAERWLRRQIRDWRVKLARYRGFEEPSPVVVCQSRVRKAYADYQNRQLYILSFTNSEDRITLAHEYLHLGFQFHPSSTDEQFVENLARQLTP